MLMISYMEGVDVLRNLRKTHRESNGLMRGLRLGKYPYAPKCGSIGAVVLLLPAKLLFGDSLCNSSIFAATY